MKRSVLIFYLFLLIITFSLLSCGKKAPPVLSEKESFAGLAGVRGTYALESAIDIDSGPSPNLTDPAGCRGG